MKRIFKSMVQSAILDKDPEIFAEEFYDYGGSLRRKILQLEVFGDEDDETLTERTFYAGCGGHTKEFMDYKGQKHAFHISCSTDVEEIQEDFGSEYVKLWDWTMECRVHEMFLQKTEDLIAEVDRAESREDVVLPENKNYNETLIEDMLDRKFGEE